MLNTARLLSRGNVAITVALIKRILVHMTYLLGKGPNKSGGPVTL